MIHDVPRGNDPDEHTILTDVPIQLDDDLRLYFRRKIVDSLTERGVEVVADTDEDDTVRQALVRVLADPAELVAVSRDIATRLDDVQTGRNPAGLLAVIVGTVDAKPCVSVLKLEREQGLRFRIQTVEGRTIVDLEHLRDLTLTDKTKVFKTSLFAVMGKAKPKADSIFGHVSDDQRGSETTAGVANFFLGTFLGCRLRDSPERATFAFVQGVDAFVNNDVVNAEKRGRYQVALLASMQDNSVEVRPRSFANAHIDNTDRPALFERLREAGVDPDTTFPKDISLVKVRGFRMTFDSGMVLVGTRSDLEDRVHIRDETANQPGVDINDTIEALRGR
jgi:hypothetical protein